MKTIFRYANVGLLLAAIMAIGAVAGFAQDPCTDAEGQKVADEKFRKAFPDKTIDGRKLAIEAGKQFVEKYGACEGATKELSDYLKTQIPKMETALKTMVDADAKNKLVARFNTALNAKNWDEVYAAGKEILGKYPDEFRDVELALGSIGYDESYKGNFKYNDETLRFAKMSITDLESGKTFSASYGVPKDFVYKSKENALGWMNLAIGYITQVAQKNKKDAQSYLYKATQVNSETNKNPIPYEMIGNYYFDELNKITEEIKTLAADQKDTDTPEVAKTKVDAIKAKVALANGISERAMDAFSRAYTHGQAGPYKAKMKKNVEDAYKLRFAKTGDVDAWIASAVTKPFPNPTTPVTPISDPEPATTTTTTTSTTPPVTPPATKPGATTTVRPAPPAGAKPASAVTAAPVG